MAQDGDILQALTTIVKDAQTPVEWVACEPGGIDRQLLLDQSSPILMYDDVVLFEDFIHDHGVVRMNVKTRIMPRCWYVLLRFWLRVDGVVMKVRAHLDYRKNIALTPAGCMWPPEQKDVEQFDEKCKQPQLLSAT